MERCLEAGLLVDHLDEDILESGAQGNGEIGLLTYTEAGNSLILADRCETLGKAQQGKGTIYSIGGHRLPEIGREQRSRGREARCHRRSIVASS